MTFFDPTASAVVGIDVGYSGTKIATAQGTYVLPSAAGPIDLLPDRFGAADDTILVQIAGQTWAAGVEPTRFQRYSRVLHSDYPRSEQYRALFLAGLVRSGCRDVGVLVTGLPVSQYADKERVQDLKSLLTGRHQPTEKSEIKVQSVFVYPQPLGSWAEVVATEGEDFSRLRTLVLDPGYFSVDYTIIAGGELRQHSSGTSTQAMSALIDHISFAIRLSHGGSPAVDEIEKSLRTGETLTYRGQGIDLVPIIKAVAADRIPAILDSVRSAIRHEGDLDAVILTGGGASAYADSVRQTFQVGGTRVIIPASPATANARGFLRLAQARAAQ